ncbi:MAG: precorrin-2 C(20)-methyltransferase [Ruminiclostridium sp.]|nr:precorrin-2 C(20)-methyltransferase [Ruminiclostridium sp.]
MYGKFYCVSVGPGDPELMTLRSVRIIERCDVIAAPRTSGGNMLAFSIAEKVCDMSEKAVLPLDFPMKADETAQRENHRLIAETFCSYLRKGQDVAMLNIGDVSVYSSCTYIAAELTTMGFDTEMCAGVPSFCAAAAELNIPLAEAKEPIVIVPAQYEKAGELLVIDGTKVIMKGGKKLSDIKNMIKNDSKIYAAENCGFADQHLYHSINDMDGCGYFTVVIVK